MWRKQFPGFPHLPGYDLTIGVTGEKVQQIQEQLNAIAKAYPAIPTVTVDGIYGPATAASVKNFRMYLDFPRPEWWIIQPGIRFRKFMWQ